MWAYRVFTKNGLIGTTSGRNFSSKPLNLGESNINKKGTEKDFANLTDIIFPSLNNSVVASRGTSSNSILV